ncbi:Hypothetical protein CINCED_3A002015 [Cinara cedri]|uniref:Uncharacterized protein n=1 Tax=Cinara cedri TaxID=506608 RepID=A0A5E4NL93_9HEMI|nr:Hypothetical protein CINCED_3A002015 [Cinara cedri]
MDNLQTTGNLKKPISAENRDYVGKQIQMNAFKSSPQTDLGAQVNREPVVMASKTADSIEPVISFSPKFQHHSQFIMTPAPISIVDELGPSDILTNTPMLKTQLVDEIQASSESLPANLSTVEIEPVYFNSATSMADPMSQTRLANEPTLLNIGRSLPTQMLQKADFAFEPEVSHSIKSIPSDIRSPTEYEPVSPAPILSAINIKPAYFISTAPMADSMLQTRLPDKPAMLNIASPSLLPTQMLQKTDFGSESPALWESRFSNAPMPITQETDNIKYDDSPIEQTKLATFPSNGLSYSSPLIYNKMATTTLKSPSIDISNQYSDPITSYKMPLSTFSNQPFDGKVMMTDKLDTSFSQYAPAAPAKSIELLPAELRLQTPSEYEPISPAPILRTAEIENNPFITAAPMASTPLLKIRLAKESKSLNAARRPVVSKQMLQNIGFSSAALFETHLADDSVPTVLKTPKYNVNPIGQNRFAILPMENTEYQSQFITPELTADTTNMQYDSDSAIQSQYDSASNIQSQYNLASSTSAGHQYY